MNDTIQNDFRRDGFAILPKFYSEAEIDAVLAKVAERVRERPLNVVIDLLDTNERTILGLLSEQDIERRAMKINDLYLDTEIVRELALSERLSPILVDLLGHPVVLCNSLYLEKGSQQAAHVDSLYMTPRTPGHLIASWVALEDTHVDAGPLEYFPGSHLIGHYVFSNGSRHFIPDEMPKWSAYIEKEVAQRGLTKQSFAAKKGNVFIWSSDLLHGGSPINDPSRTRKSLVFHYFSQADAQAAKSNIKPLSAGYWMDRPPQHVSSEVQTRVKREALFRKLQKQPLVGRIITRLKEHFA